MRVQFICLLGILGLALAHAHAAFPPKGFVVLEGSESPDGHYAVLVPTADSLPPDTEFDEKPSRIVDLKTHQTVGPLRGTLYYERFNHHGMRVFWAPDSTWCVVEDDDRFAFNTLAVVEIEHGRVQQHAIEARVDAMLKGEMARHKGEELASTSAYIRPGADRKVRLRALGDNNPKRFPDKKTYCALFQGTYDLATRRWTISDVRSITEEQSDLLSSAYQPLEPAGRVFTDDEEHAKWLDDQLNAVYGAIRQLLPPARFATVKEEQIAWLKAQPADASANQRSAAWTARIKVLEKLLW